MTMPIFLCRRKPEPPPQVCVKVIRRDPLRYTIEQWRQSDELVAEAFKALNSQPLRGMLDCVWATHLARHVPDSCDPVLQAAVAHRIRGFNAALEALQSLGVKAVKAEPPKDDFADSNADELFGINRT